MNNEYDSPVWLGDPVAKHIATLVNYILWDCSTSYMASHGMPTDEQVAAWIEVLEDREDSADESIRAAIKDCKEYIKPYEPPGRTRSGTRAVPVGTVIKVRKVSSKEM